MKSTRTGHRWVAVMIAAMGTMLAAAIAAPGQTFKNLHSFDNTDGALPRASVLQGINGTLYGTTEEGGLFTGTCFGSGCGTVFMMTQDGTLTTMHEFDYADGYGPNASVIQLIGGTLYGTTVAGGAYSQGSVFEITPNGTLTTLNSFCNIFDQCQGGEYVDSPLVQASNGDFYGTTEIGGANGWGTVFRIAPSGTLTTLYNFCSQTGCTDGAQPYAGLVEGTDGNLYGTTFRGGTGQGCSTATCGTVFKITPSGIFSTLHSFDLTDGANPWEGLIQASDGNFYGTTSLGGANNGGTVFRINAGGTLTKLYSFCPEAGCPDGQYPIGAPVQATDGNLYGTTDWGGGSSLCQNGCGTIFRITLSGTLTTLHRFDSADGALPSAALIQATNGTLYGTTQEGGSSGACSGGCGTVFRLSTGLGPFVETVPTSGKVGITILILGTKLTGATSVTFNGTAGAFTVGSATAIKTTVPAGATTGPVQVVTPSGTLTSNVNFRVLP
jgi:uncharacterized repeat protein (TIGR03803 family)